MKVDKTNKNNSVDIHYEKNPLYRTIHTDGAVGGVTPLNQVNINFYSTRNSIPKSMNQKINDDGTLNEESIEISTDSKSGIIREIEIGLYMNRQTALDIYNFLKTILENE